MCVLAAANGRVAWIHCRRLEHLVFWGFEPAAQSVARIWSKQTECGRSVGWILQVYMSWYIFEITYIHIPPFDGYPIYNNLADGLDRKRWTNRFNQPLLSMFVLFWALVLKDSSEIGRIKSSFLLMSCIFIYFIFKLNFLLPDTIDI